MLVTLVGFKHIQYTKDNRSVDGYEMHFSFESSVKDFNGFETKKYFIPTNRISGSFSSGSVGELQFGFDYKGEAAVTGIKF